MLAAGERGECDVRELGQLPEQIGRLAARDVTVDDLEDRAHDRLRAQARQLLGLRTVAVALLEKDRGGPQGFVRAADRLRAGRVTLDESQMADRWVLGDQADQRSQCSPDPLR